MSFYDFSADRLGGVCEKFDAYKGQVVLVVNTASLCGFTPQLEGLENLFQSYKEEGFTVLAFPCNQFGGQEPGSAEDIGRFCSDNYDLTFPIFEKIEVNGADAHPFYDWLKAEKPGLAGTRAVKWNFTKFLLGRSGQVVKRYPPTVQPVAIRADIEALLQA